MARRRLSDLERRARERMRLVSPENAGKVLSADIYWTVPFLELYLERCDEIAFEDPRQAHLLARHAPGLAALIGVGARPGEYAGEMQKRSFRVHALAVHAGICRRIGELSEATRQYRLAFDLLDAGAILPRAEAELRARHALLLHQVQRLEESIVGYTRALDLLTQIGDPAGKAQVLVLRAGWYWTQQDPTKASLDLAESFAEAAKAISDPRAERAVTTACKNMALLLSERPLSLSAYSRAAALIEAARKRTSRSRTSLIKMKILWIEASINRALHFAPHAYRLLSRARDGFKRLAVPDFFAIASLEMAAMLLEDGDFESLDQLRKDTVTSLNAMTEDALFLNALGQWSSRPSDRSLNAIKRSLQERSA